MQSDAPVMIILGTLVVITALGTMHSILGNFGGNQFSDSQPSLDSYTELHNRIESQCSRLEEYDQVLSSTVELNLNNNAEIRYEDPNLLLERDDEELLERDVSCDIEFNVIESGEIGAGNWEAEIFSESEQLHVEVRD